MAEIAGAAERVLAAAGADAAVWLRALPDGVGLEVQEVGGDAQAAQRLADDPVREALGRAFRADEEGELRGAGEAVVGYAQPVRRDGAPVGMLALAWREPRAEIGDDVRLAARLVAGEVAQELAWNEAERAASERRAFELHDGVVQGLVVAKYAIEADRPDLARGAVDQALDRARRLVSAELGDDVTPGSLARERAALAEIPEEEGP